MNGLLTPALLSMACGVLGAAAVHAVVPRAEAQQIASIDINGLVQARIDALRRDDTALEDAERIAAAWGQELVTRPRCSPLKKTL